ncbi:MAG: L-2-amino-thiazoline-4-carboxylic acid hydrolase [Myxococcota bacterium]|jgi:hypothetical protein|nr:L-2-amino-thiazoline-4-carboxylic acid hydrolase [Myxococcota bacterium]
MLTRFYTQCFLAGNGAPLPGPGNTEARRLLADHAAKAYREIVSTLPRQPTLGARAVTRFTAVGVAFFQAALAAGIARQEAIRSVERANRRALGPFVKLGSRLRGGLGRRPITRARRVFFFMNRVFPFASPGWQRADVELGPGAVGFDYTSCPIAVLTREQGALDLCTGAYCELDHWIGEALELRLHRTETIALGHARCRFRWHPADASASAAGAEPGKGSGQAGPPA